ncbi:MAG TPA: electron transfer flavoprotein subunit alpha/FixB family protein [Saprospiraceae bacterium]|nr:electron transfer flavoprotein subunit alpha/FixB family protein [Saprospiraceae bacterium]
MVLVVAETIEGKIKNSTFETMYYGSKVAEILGTSCSALILGPCSDGGRLGSFGAGEVLHVNDAVLGSFDSQVYTKVITQIAKEKGAKVVIVADSSNGKSVLGRLAITLNAGPVRGINKLPELKDGKLLFERPVFSGKAKATCRVNTDIAVVSLMGNSLKPQSSGADVSPVTVSTEIPSYKTKVTNVSRSVGIVPLPEAQIVVSAGRGMKDPSNWGIVEELAEVIGATTACSRPVADSGWRPHHEHVGQTGIAIRPNLYIAIGISGAIQHLAGVNSSKVIVVINKDPEAPFFKAADYGVVGDLFEVVPRLTEALKKFKSTHH